MTFVSPFDSLGENIKAANAQWELWTGAFSCEEKDCFGVATEAKYFPKEKLLTWMCPEGHIGKIEDYQG